MSRTWSGKKPLVSRCLLTWRTLGPWGVCLAGDRGRKRDAILILDAWHVVNWIHFVQLCQQLPPNQDTCLKVCAQTHTRYVFRHRGDTWEISKGPILLKSALCDVTEGTNASVIFAGSCDQWATMLFSVFILFSLKNSQIGKRFQYGTF